MVSACQAPTVPSGPAAPSAQFDDVHIPPFARLPYQRLSREAAVQIALREWRAFNQPVVLPHTELPFDNERAEGLWQRVGEYWWLGLPLGAREQGFTGIHDENGRVFSDKEDGNFAWSAAFIDYVMRMAGAGRRFPYSPTHADYINAARQNAAGGSPRDYSAGDYMAVSCHDYPTIWDPAADLATRRAQLDAFCHWG